MPWADLIEPAKQIALDGFEIDTNYSFIIASRTTQLKSSSYGEETFFTNTGDPLAPGDVFRQPELAVFLGEYIFEPGQCATGDAEPWSYDLFFTRQQLGRNLCGALSRSS